MKKKRKALVVSLLSGIGILSLSLVLFLHISMRQQKINEVDVQFVFVTERAFPELCEAIVGEEVFYLDGRFPLEVLSCAERPSLLRFYDGERGVEFTVPSSMYSDFEITLRAPAREHPFGYALGGVRTVNVGMGVVLFGENCKVYGKIVALCVSDIGNSTQKHM